uniref:Uncharacterized protein n=1 Tax=Prochlorococcus marinus str. P0902-H212 TaxID=1620696 RepID=A0A0D5A1H9_PROMR|nr:hypothetical protein FA02_0103 [Prochlorococcus marinus str. P0902-H212]
MLIRPWKNKFFEFCNKNKILRESYESLVVAVLRVLFNLAIINEALHFTH